MKKIKQKLSSILIVNLFLITAHAQQETIVTGGTIMDSGGSVSYSIGQVVFTTFSDANGSVAQGVQQPYEISVVTDLEDTFVINLNLLAYPNPTTDFLNLQISNLENEKLSYQLFDISGKLLETKKVTSNTEAISMVNFATATYFLKISNNNKIVKTFKIIKN